jgi:hypothetical protein
MEKWTSQRKGGMAKYGLTLARRIPGVPGDQVELSAPLVSIAVVGYVLAGDETATDHAEEGS